MKGCSYDAVFISQSLKLAAIRSELSRDCGIGIQLLKPNTFFSLESINVFFRRFDFFFQFSSFPLLKWRQTPQLNMEKRKCKVGEKRSI